MHSPTIAALLLSVLLFAPAQASLPSTGAESLDWLLWVGGGLIVIALIIFGFRIFKDHDEE